MRRRFAQNAKHNATSSAPSNIQGACVQDVVQDASIYIQDVVQDVEIVALYIQDVDSEYKMFLN